MVYRRRIIDDLLDEYFPSLAAIALEGAKGVGKTATGSQRVESVLSVANPEVRVSLSANLNLIEQVPGPVLIDEWQLVPAVWDRVRRAADVRHLNWLQQSLGERVADRVVVYAGKHAYRRKDGVAVVPLALLGP
jgi:hypothetical protein